MKNTELEKIYETHNDAFAKSNYFIASKYKATLLEEKLWNIALSRIQQQQYIDKGELGGLEIKLKASELKKMLGITSGTFYAQLKQAAAALTARTMGFVNDELKAFKYVSAILSSEYYKGILTIKFNPELKQYLTPDTKFTVLDIYTMLQYNNLYALRLHEMLLSCCYKTKKVGMSKYTLKETDGRHYKIDSNLNELKLFFGIVNAELPSVKRVLNGSKTPDYDKAVEKASEKSCNVWYDMRRQVLDVAIKEINEMDNGISVFYEPVKSGRGGKVCGVSFFVELADPKGKPQEQQEANRELTEDEKFEVQVSVHTMLAKLTNDRVKMKGVSAICKAAGYDIGKIQVAFEVASAAGKLENPVGFFIKAIQDGYQPGLPVKGKQAGKKSKNSFHNFEPRAYDWDDMERQLLQAQMKKEY